MKSILILLSLAIYVIAEVPTKTIVNAQTGEVTVTPLTPEELAQRAAEEAAQVADPTSLPVITAWQAKAALALTPHGETNLLAVTQQILDAMPASHEKTVLLAKWNHNAQFRATDPAIVAIATQLGLTQVQIKTLFELASSLE